MGTWERFEDDVLGDCVLEAEGDTLELFRGRSAEAMRVHRALINVAVSGPNRRGIVQVDVTNAPNRRGGGFQLNVDEPTWARLRPLVEPTLTR